MDRRGEAGVDQQDVPEGTALILHRLRTGVLTVGIVAGLGAVSALAATQYLESRFRAQTQLVIRGANADVVHAAMHDLRSKPAIDNVIRALNLDRGDEFSSNRPTVTGIVSDIVSGDVNTVSEAEEALRQRLREAMTTAYDPKGRKAMIGVGAADPDKAAAIANRLAEEFERALIANAGSRPDPQMEAMRQAADRAESALAGFIANLDKAALAKLQDLDVERAALDAEIQATGHHLSDLEDAHAAATSMTVDHVLSKPLPDTLEFTGLEYQRRRYVQAQLDLEQLSANLGPKHPRRAAAQAALDDAKTDIEGALRQLSASLQEQVSATGKALAGLTARRTAALPDNTMAEAASKLSALQAAASESRRNVERAEADPTRQRPVSIPSLQVLAPASAAAVERLGPDTATVVAGGGAIGGALGLALLAWRYRRQSRLAEELQEETIHLDIPRDTAEPERGQAGVASDEPVDDMPTVRDGEYIEPPVAANAGIFGDRMKALLLEHRQSAAETSLPPIVAALVDQSQRLRSDETQVDRSDIADHEPHYDEEELFALQRELAELRRLVRYHEANELKAAG